MSERSLKVDAVVLRHADWGEADRLLTLYAREAGKLRAVAKGARKMRSRKAGHLEPFTRVSLLMARGRDMWIVTQAETLDAYLPLRENLVLTGYASYVLELLDRFTYEEGQHPAIYSLLVDSLERLVVVPDTFVVVRYYELHLLDLFGFRPELVHCPSCGREIQPQDQFFSAQLGGALCPDCGARTPGSRPVSMAALKYLRHYQRSSFSQALAAQIPQPVRLEMEALLNHYITYLLECGLNTPAFIRKVSDA